MDTHSIKLLIIHDYEYQCPIRGLVRWAYANRAAALKANAPDNFKVDCISSKQLPQSHDLFHAADVVFLLDYASIFPVRSLDYSKKIVTSFNRDRNSKNEWWSKVQLLSSAIISNNQDRYDWAIENGHSNRVYCIDNGVDTKYWLDWMPLEHRIYDVIWTGSTKPVKRKNYYEVLVPLSKELDKHGITHDFRGIEDTSDQSILGVSQQRCWYNLGKIYLSVSSSEGGGPSSVLEAMSCGCALVTTNVGSVQTFGKSEIIEPNVESALSGIKNVLSDIESRRKTSKSIAREWSYGEPGYRAKFFFDLFENIHNDNYPETFSWKDVTNG